MARISVLDCQPELDSLADEVLAGLSRPRKQLPCKLFYDERGSRLFDRICELPEYYPTRTEQSILERHVDDMAQRIGPRVRLVEYGSGSSLKTQILLDHLADPAGYVPVDISYEHLAKSAERVASEHEGLLVLPVCADFTDEFGLPSCPPPVRRTVVFFPGSTIGNFEPAAAVAVLSRMRQHAGSAGGVLIGVDLDKSPAVLEAAYDDAAGVTAEFNLNALRHINQLLDANFDIDDFEHLAVYNPDHTRIELYLVSKCDQSVVVGGREFTFRRGERIHTEYSHKYSLGAFAQLADQAGFRVRDVWLDDDHLFSIQYLESC